MLRLESGAKQLTDANKKQKKKKGIARPRLLIYSVHASCSASIRLRLYRRTRHIGTVSADTSMSCRFSSSAVSKKDSGGAGFHTSHSTHSLPPAQLPCWRLQPSAWRLRGRGNKKSLCGVFSLWGESVRRSNEKKKGLPSWTEKRLVWLISPGGPAPPLLSHLFIQFQLQFNLA